MSGKDGDKEAAAHNAAEDTVEVTPGLRRTRAVKERSISSSPSDILSHLLLYILQRNRSNQKTDLFIHFIVY